MASIPPPTERAGWQPAEALRDIGRRFYGRGWSVGTSSNYSVVLQQEPLQLLLTASGKDKGALEPEDFVVVDAAGRPLDGEPAKPSAETMLHCVLAAEGDVGAVLHTHSVWGTLLSDYYADRGAAPIEGYEMLKGLAGVGTHEHRQEVVIFENTQDIPALAEQVRRQMQDADRPLLHGFLIRNHGLYAWGADLFEARRHIEIFEFLFEVLGRKLMLPSRETREQSPSLAAAD